MIDVFDLTLEELMELEVYSTSKKKEKVIETPASVNIITSDDIKLLNFNSKRLNIFFFCIQKYIPTKHHQEN